MTDERKFVAVPVDVISRALAKALAEYHIADMDGGPGETWAEFEALADYLPGQIEDLEIDSLGDVERVLHENDELRMALDEFVKLADRVRELASRHPSNCKCPTCSS